MNRWMTCAAVIAVLTGPLGAVAQNPEPPTPASPANPAPAAPAAPSAAPSRGQMLYGNHCIACHTTQMHWRDKKLVADWVGLKVQVRRWQGTAQLNWSEEDIDDVARYLNDTYYRLPAGKVAALSAGLTRP